mmetsp:Transcript_11588/g.20143  ORF Transcript_11588/g.20143 Transcript_11588/m.20143 type:complete len:81 (+) Transcript_11588:160-402(+)
MFASERDARFTAKWTGSHGCKERVSCRLSFTLGIQFWRRQRLEDSVVAWVVVRRRLSSSRCNICLSFSIYLHPHDVVEAF